jgi:hypothetical protein
MSSTLNPKKRQLSTSCEIDQDSTSNLQPHSSADEAGDGITSSTSTSSTVSTPKSPESPTKKRSILPPRSSEQNAELQSHMMSIEQDDDDEEEAIAETLHSLTCCLSPLPAPRRLDFSLFMCCDGNDDMLSEIMSYFVAPCHPTGNEAMDLLRDGISLKCMKSAFFTCKSFARAVDKVLGLCMQPIFSSTVRQIKALDRDFEVHFFFLVLRNITCFITNLFSCFVCFNPRSLHLHPLSSFSRSQLHITETYFSSGMLLEHIHLFRSS